MDRKRVLFLCVHNSARSQMAEAFLNALAGDRFCAESAGFEPGVLNPVVVKAMKEIGIDISGNSTTSVFDLYKAGELYEYVITVCDEAHAEQCPTFPGHAQRIHWGFEDPSMYTGTHVEKLEKIRKLRDAIRQRVEQWVRERT